MLKTQDTYRDAPRVLRARSVHSLATRIAAPSRALLARCDRAQSSLKPGTRVGDYAVTAKLHEGRWTTTYSAIQGSTGKALVVRILDAEQRHNPLARACLRRAAKVADLSESEVDEEGRCPVRTTESTTETVHFQVGTKLSLGWVVYGPWLALPTPQ